MDPSLKHMIKACACIAFFTASGLGADGAGDASDHGSLRLQHKQKAAAA